MTINNEILKRIKYVDENHTGTGTNDWIDGDYIIPCWVIRDWKKFTPQRIMKTGNVFKATNSCKCQSITGDVWYQVDLQRITIDGFSEIIIRSCLASKYLKVTELILPYYRGLILGDKFSI